MVYQNAYLLKVLNNHNADVSFLSYLQTLNICVGITASGDIFGVNLKSKTFNCEKITNFQYDKITVNLSSIL